MKFLKNIKKDKEFWLVIFPISTFSFLDLLTTWFGVCYLKGIELNIKAILIHQKFGYLLGSLIFFLINFLIAFTLYKFIKKFKGIYKIFFIAVLTIVLLNFASVVYLNISALIRMGLGIEFLETHDISTFRLEEIKKVFNRERFCRLWP